MAEAVRVRGERGGRSRGEALFGMGYVSSGGGPYVEELIFGAELKTTLVPWRALGSATPTFTRATTAMVEDFEGLLKPVLSGEARFNGARRVRNLVTTPDLSNAAWTKENGGTGTAATLTYGQTDPNGGVTATRVQANRGAGNTASDYSGVYFRAIASGATTTATGRIAVKSNTGSSQTFTLKLDASGTSKVQLTATTSWQVFSVSYEQSGNQDFEILSWGTHAASTNSLDLLVAFPQVENVTGQSNQNPSEYVSVGVLSAPYHGAGVDGVRYFSTENGNVVASNVVTEATGAAISTSTLLGYLAEGQRTNLCLQSQTLDNATWSKTRSSVSANATAAPDGTTTADKLVEDSTATSTHFSQQSITVSNTTAYTYSVWVKAAERTWCAVGVNKGGGTGADDALQYVNMSTGALGATIGSGVTLTTEAYQNGWYRVKCSFTSNGTNALVYFVLASGDSGQTYSGDGSSGAYAWGAQLETAAFASSYIPTAAASVTRNADVLTYVAAGNVIGTVGAAYAEVADGRASGEVSLDSNVVWAGTDAGLMYRGANSSSLRIYDGTSERTLANFAVSTSVRKIATAWGGSGCSGVVAGGTVATAAFDGVATLGTNLAIGVREGTAGTEWFGTIRNARIYNRKLSDATLQALTT